MGVCGRYKRVKDSCKKMNEELTLNIELSPLALKLRTLRLQKNLSTETLSILSKITEEDILAFETDKKVPTEEEKQILFDLLK